MSMICTCLTFCDNYGLIFSQINKKLDILDHWHQKSVMLRPDESIMQELRAIRAEKEATIGRRKYIDNDLSKHNQEIKKQVCAAVYNFLHCLWKTVIFYFSTEILALNQKKCGQKMTHFDMIISNDGKIVCSLDHGIFVFREGHLVNCIWPADVMVCLSGKADVNASSSVHKLSKKTLKCLPYILMCHCTSLPHD